MTTTLPTPLDSPLPPEPLTVEQYHQMIDKGILEEGSPFELLHGIITRKDRAAAGEDPMTSGNHHAYVVNLLAALDRKLEGTGCFLQTQQPIALPPFDEPEPDAAVILGARRDYRNHKPTAPAVLAVIEVADSSLRRDRTTKLKIYAQANLPLYLLINLPEKCIEQYTRPLPTAARYANAETLTARQSLTLPLPKKKSLKVSVASLLP
ncbi:MAG TPA: Uma2 family endonuclease [Phycisphaerae bacterium]|nr:Uma2 family endonuclease [Phycisphaerae bacterium]